MTGAGAAYDVVVVGGGAAGLSGALMLARSRRSVLVVDGGSPRNAPAEGVHGFISRDGVPPGELLATGRAEVRSYGGDVVHGVVRAATRVRGGFDVRLDDDRVVRTRRLLVATGVVDELPDVPGLRERWGRDVVHCPYCHGWEVRDQPIGVVSTGEMSVHQALLFRQLSSDVVLLQHDGPAPTPDEAVQLAALGVPVVTGRLQRVVVEDDRITGVELDDGRVLARSVLAVGSRVVARSALLTSLGLVLVEAAHGSWFEADLTGRSAVPDVWLAGNVSSPMAQVVASAAAGAMAGAAINADLVQEDVRRLVDTSA
ncbi:NAD(P)/FAD-dependent oxidoreductase [Angustibacter peucedani]